MAKNAIVGQSGGPTSVINSSLAGVYESCKRRGAGKVYGMMHGVAGLLERRVCVLDDKLKSAMDIELLKRTPSSYLGSCRYKLPDWHTAEGEAVYQKLFEILGELDIGYFFYIGGNDSMDTIGKLADYGAHIGSDIRFMGVPKTIDNDLMVTDHTPGYGSAAKYIGVVMKEIIRDATVYGTKYVTIVEIMGRNAGWLTAASVLARKFEGDNPVLIYLPEVAFSPDAFIEKVKEKLTKTSNLVVCISEGINDGNGTFVCELASDVGTDTFGHKMLTGSGKYLENLVKEKLGIKVRSVELNVCQRCSSSCLSATDLDEAAASGRFAVSAALDGETGKMINFIRKSDDPYILEFGTADVNEICNKEKAVPEEWITKDGSDIGDEFIAYARPLIQGSVEVPMKDGLPYFAFRK